VNIAARLASQAIAGQVYVGEALAGSVRQDGFRLIEVGSFELKGIANAVKVFEAVPAGSE
jgi:class 3 adenylate cyclase